MPIPEGQLETWSSIGSQTQSKDTYATVRNALSRDDAPYNQKDKTVQIFLQGSYGNDTNVYRESDVDVVIRLIGSVFYHDASQLSLSESTNFEKAYPNTPDYNFFNFKADVLSHLTNRFGAAVTGGKKAICVEAGGGRRRADVIPCVEFRRYKTYSWAGNPDDYISGICFFTTDLTRIVNFPKQHSENATTKHQATKGWYKPMVRIFKNMRNRLVSNNALDIGVAPSYYIEGLLYNAPNNLYGKSYEDSFVNIFNWIDGSDRLTFWCANEQYKLLNGDQNVTWNSANCDKFLAALRILWTDW